jgi:hypothetical protein
MVNLIIHRSLRGVAVTGLLRRHMRDGGQRLITGIPQRAVPQSTLMLDSPAVWALSHRRP